MHKTCACPYLCLPCNCLLYPCRKAVSRSKRRFRENGYDLDLAYVAPRIIVHGFPAVGIEHLYRNPRLEIRRFMDEYHKDHYKMFNFCCEPGRGYEPEVFYHRIERYPFKDHNTPPLATMVAFAESAKSWLDQDVANVVNMHCKAGKGRAGLMCCVLLVRTGIVQSAKEALDLYDQKRVTNNRGLTVTSQRKFVILYEALWRKHWGVTGDIGSIPGQSPDSTRFVIPEEPAIRVFGVELLGFLPGTVNNIRVRIYKGTNGLPILLHDSRHSPRGVTAIDCDCVVQGNFKLIVEQTSGMSSSKIFEFLHNTLFVERFHLMNFSQFVLLC